jgi:hypothetical protein
MSYIQELVKNLSKEVPFKWRVQGRNKAKDKVQITAYIDARQVQDILDQYCEHGWSNSFYEIAGGIFCKLIIHGPIGETYIRSDAGSRIESDSTDQMFDQGFKAAASDAFKRAAVQFGVGRFLYDQPKMWLPCNEKGQPVDERGQVIWELSEYMAKQKAGKTASVKATATATATPSASQTTNVVSPSAPAPAAPQATPAAPQADKSASQPEVKKMTDTILAEMLKFIQEGKKDPVREAMGKYNMTLAQKKVLEAALSK